MSSLRPDPIARLRELCLGLPEVEEQPFAMHSSPAFRVRNKIFVMVGEDLGRLTLKAGPGVQQALVGDDPERYYIPPYVGAKGWVGVVLDGELDWSELTELVEDSYRLIAPKRLVAQLDAGSCDSKAAASDGERSRRTHSS
jgi:predicted DNA-binding protein (MmcQ/YjbR family)